MCIRDRSLAVQAAVDAVFAVGEFENLRQFLFRGGDTARIFTLDDIRNRLRQFRVPFLGQHAVHDYIDGDIRVDISQRCLLYTSRCV